MGFKIKLDRGKLRRLDRAAVTALEQTGEALHTEVLTAQVMPFDIGTMQNESTFVDTSESAAGTVSLVTSTPNARRLNNHPEYNFRTVNNPDARGKWLEAWIDGDRKDFCTEAFKKLYRQGAGL